MIQAKLTEEELAARLATMKLKSEQREASHRRAEADEASFHEREKLEQVKKLEEKQNRRVLEGEREKNRLRKLKAVEGREWDAEKREEDLFGGPVRGGSQFRRGAYGGVTNDTARTGEENMRYRGVRGGRGDYAARGHRGGRASQGRGGSSRGGSGRGQVGNFQKNPEERIDDSRLPPAIDTEAEFPALPGAPKTNKEADKSKVTQEPSSLITPVEGTWAEQMEISGAGAGATVAGGS